MRLPRGNRLARRLVDIATICAAGLAIAAVVGLLQDSTPFGDDALHYIGETRALTANFPFLAWDPHAFAGYVPTIGLSWLTYLPPSLLLRMGLDALSSFHLTFVCEFLLYGVSVYYFARSAGSDKIVSFSIPILAWSTNAYWNLTVWGGAYDRAFTIPMMFFSFGTTYRYVSQLNSGIRVVRYYWLSLLSWTLLFLGDVFVASAAACLGFIFLLLSGGRHDLASGLKRTGVIFLPLAGLAVWQVVPVVLQAILFAPFRNQYTVPNDLSLLFLPGNVWVSTLNLVYVPGVLAIGVLCLLTRVRMSLTQGAFLIALSVMGAYWFVMGWVPSLWQYLPRLMATYNSVENLGWIFLMALPIMLGMLRNQLGTVDRFVFHIRSNSKLSVSGRRLTVLLGAFTMLFIVGNAIILIPTIKTVNWGPLSDQLNAALDSSLGAPSNDYRISLQNRVLTRSFFFYQPDRFDTGGRAALLDPDPFFNSWYMTDVFYKNDLGSIDTVYIDDRPVANVSSLIESPSNFGGEKFWLDWYGVNAAVFYDYSFDQTLGNYSARPSLFSVVERPTTYAAPEIIVKPASPSAILVATNATIIGFYSAARNSQDEYRSLISLLSEMGLGSRFVIPLYLQSIADVFASPIQLLVTDSFTYSEKGPEMQTLFQTADIVVLSSMDVQPGLSTTAQPMGNRLLVDMPVSLSQLVNGREEGAYYFARSALILPITSINTTTSAYYPPETMILSPNTWSASYRTSNAEGSLQTQQNSVTLNVTSSDTTRNAQFNIQSYLPSRVPLSNDLLVSFSVQTTANITLGVSFSSTLVCCQNYVAIDQQISSGRSVDFQIPFSRFYKWYNSSAMFGVARDLTFSVDLPSGNPNVVVQIANVSVASPAYTISTLAEPLSLSSDGVLEHDTTAIGVGLLNRSNSSTTILNLSGDEPRNISTLASFSGGEASEQYDEVLTIGGNGLTAPSVALFLQESPYSTVHEEWTNNENMVAQSIPQGFRGLLWKETYSPLWKIGSESNLTRSQLNYYYAGPGMIYVPMANFATGIKASISSTGFQSLALASAPVFTIAALAVLRNRLPVFGSRKQEPAAEVEKH